MTYEQALEFNRIVVVGASSGMGAAIVERLQVPKRSIVGIDLDTAIWPENIRFQWRVEADVSSETSVQKALAEAADLMGGIDVVINCAGILGPVGPLVEIAPKDTQRVIAVNLHGAMNITRAALKYLLPQQQGRIVHIASIAGKEGNPGMAAYSASKAGVIGMVKAVAKEVASQGITVNAVAPASIDTPLIQRQMTAARREEQKGLIPMKRFGSVQEAAALVEYIISSEASFTTGFTYDLSGGRAVY